LVFFGESCIFGEHSGAESGTTVVVEAARKLNVLKQHGWDLCRTAFNFHRLSDISPALCPVCSLISDEAIL
jgi:hypothetical protein